MLEIAIILILSICYIITLIPYIKIKEKKISNNLLNASTIVFIILYGLLFPINYYLSLLGFNSIGNISTYINYDAIDFLKYYLAIFCVTHAFLFIIKHKKEIKLFEEISQFIKYYILISIGIRSLAYSDPYLIIKTSFGFIMFVVLYLFVNTIKTNKANKTFSRRNV